MPVLRKVSICPGVWFEYRLFDIFLIYGNMKFYEAYSPETLSSSGDIERRRGMASKCGKKHDDISSYCMALSVPILSTPFAFKQAGV